MSSTPASTRALARTTPPRRAALPAVATSPSIAMSPRSSWSVASMRASAISASGAVPPCRPEWTGASSVRTSTSRPPCRAGMWSESARQPANCCSRRSARRRRRSGRRCRHVLAESAPSGLLLALDHHFDPDRRGGTDRPERTCGSAMPHLSSAVPRPYRRPPRSAGSNGGEVQAPWRRRAGCRSGRTAAPSAPRRPPASRPTRPARRPGRRAARAPARAAQDVGRGLCGLAHRPLGKPGNAIEGIRTSRSRSARTVSIRSATVRRSRSSPRTIDSGASCASPWSTSAPTRPGCWSPTSGTAA